MSATIGRDHVVNLVTGNPHPFAVHFDLVVVAHHAALGRVGSVYAAFLGTTLW